MWQAFCDIEAWPHWYPGVLNATWQQGEPWTPQARMQLSVQNSLRRTMTSIATVQPAPTGLMVWENRMPGLITVCRGQACALNEEWTRFTLHKTYRGAAVILLHLLKQRQVQMLCQGLENLRQQIETVAN